MNSDIDIFIIPSRKFDDFLFSIPLYGLKNMTIIDLGIFLNKFKKKNNNLRVEKVLQEASLPHYKLKL